VRASDDQLLFREWLVKQLTVSRWSAKLSLSEDELAIHLGVQPSVLREAIAKREGELKRRGQCGVVRGRRRYIGHDYAQVHVWMPKEVYKDWVEVCSALRVEPGTVLRSIIHHFLLNPKRPTVTAGQWLYRNKPLRTSRKSRFLARTRLTRGAQVALDTHADLWNVTPTGVLRGVVTDFLEGRTMKFKMVTFETLWGDPERYLHPENFKK
jgi:hypothetical protein